MKKSNIIRTYLMAIVIAFSSCDNFFEVDPADRLLESAHYSKVSEVYAAFVGTAAVFQEISANTVLLNELLGDLAIPTTQAPREFWDIARYKAKTDNPFFSPAPYYKVIINCNDFLRHAIVFNETHPNAIPEAYFNGMVSQAINYRAWCYLTIAKLYGEAVYFDEALVDYVDLSKYPVVSLEELLPMLINFVQTGVGGIDGFNVLDWSKFLNISDVSWNRISVDASVLTGEMYLWMGDYVNAIRSLTQITNITTGDELNRWKLSSSFANSKWKNIFQSSIASTSGETITVVPFDASKKQENKLYEYFINRYYVMPTDTLRSRFEKQRMKDGGMVKDLYRGEGRSYIDFRSSHGLSGAVISKYTSTSCCIPIYRAADVHLMLCEALAGCGRYEEVMILLNNGAKEYWITVEGSDGSKKSFFKAPMNDPIYNDNWRENLGVRGRVGLAPVDYKDLLSANPTEADKFQAVQQCIAEEVAMECAFEGKRWSTLVRMARNLNNPDFLLNAVVAKFPEGEREEYRTLLKENGYFFKYPQVKIEK